MCLGNEQENLAIKCRKRVGEMRRGSQMTTPCRSVYRNGLDIESEIMGELKKIVPYFFKRKTWACTISIADSIGDCQFLRAKQGEEGFFGFGILN